MENNDNKFNNDDNKIPEIKKTKIKRKRKRLYEAAKDSTTENDYGEKDEKIESTERVEEVQSAERVEEVESAESVVGYDEGRERIKQADEIVERYMRWAVGLVIVPVPLFDMVAVFVVQVKMLNKLSHLYKIGFSKTLVKSLIISLVGALNSGLVGGAIMTSIFKLFPGTGLVAGITSMCLISGATTYAVGKVFIQHFESGGTFLDFDPEKVKVFFAKQIEDGKKMAKKVKEDIRN